ncbi:MAG: protein kinase, partial [Myxococcales bacterium]|nr:protein kinase [Myxococcales bacterium]
MLPPLPPRSNPDADALARGQARLLADLSRLQSTEPTEPRPTDAPPAEATHAPWIGTQAAWEAAEPAPTSQRYAFAEVFARGGLGRVRRASDRKLGRTVAIKELLRFDDPAVHRFAREAAITARLQHPGIIPLYDLGRDDHGRPFLCMKLVEGGSLAERIAACPDLAARLALVPHVIAAADAVAYAHQHQVIHRDLKPANILVGEFGE